MARAAGPLPYLSKVTLYSSSAAGYLGSTSLTSPDLSVEEVGEGSWPLSFERCVFYVKPAGSSIRSGRQSQTHTVTYGDVVWLQHTYTGRFLTLRKRSQSLVERSCFRMSLVEENDVDDSTCLGFRILPRYKVRQEGERVRALDQVVLAMEGLDARFLHVSSARHGDGAFEVNCSTTSSSWTVMLYDGPRHPGQDCLQVGEPLFLFHQELEGFLAAKPSLFGCAAFGLDPSEPLSSPIPVAGGRISGQGLDAYDGSPCSSPARGATATSQGAGSDAGPKASNGSERCLPQAIELQAQVDSNDANGDTGKPNEPPVPQAGLCDIIRVTSEFVEDDYFSSHFSSPMRSRSASPAHLKNRPQPHPMRQLTSSLMVPGAQEAAGGAHAGAHTPEVHIPRLKVSNLSPPAPAVGGQSPRDMFGSGRSFRSFPAADSSFISAQSQYLSGSAVSFNRTGRLATNNSFDPQTFARFMNNVAEGRRHRGPALHLLHPPLPPHQPLQPPYEELGSSNALWMVEQVNATAGGVVEVSMPYRLKHIPSQRYLAIVEGPNPAAEDPGHGAEDGTDTVLVVMTTQPLGDSSLFRFQPLDAADASDDSKNFIARIQHIQTQLYLHVFEGPPGEAKDSGAAQKAISAVTLSTRPLYEDAFWVVPAPRPLMVRLNHVLQHSSVLRDTCRLLAVEDFGMDRLNRVLSATNSSLVSLINACSAGTDETAPLAGGGAPRREVQQLMLDQGVHHLVVDILKRPFRTEENPGGRLELADVYLPHHRPLYTCCIMCYRLLRQMVRGEATFALELAEHIPFMQRHVGQRLRVAETLLEIFHDNRLLLGQLSEDVLAYFVKICATNRRNAQYLDFLCVLCLCEGAPITRNQDVICQQLLKKKAHVLLPMQRQQGQVMVMLPQHLMFAYDVEGDTAIPAPDHSMQSAIKHVLIANQAARNQERLENAERGKWVPLNQFCENYPPAIVHYLETSLKLFATLCVDNPATRQEIRGLVPLDLLRTALQPPPGRPELPDALRCQFFRIAAHVYVEAHSTVTQALGPRMTVLTWASLHSMPRLGSFVDGVMPDLKACSLAVLRANPQQFQAERTRNELIHAVLELWHALLRHRLLSEDELAAFLQCAVPLLDGSTDRKQRLHLDHKLVHHVKSLQVLSPKSRFHALKGASKPPDQGDWRYMSTDENALIMDCKRLLTSILCFVLDQQVDLATRHILRLFYRACPQLQTVDPADTFSSRSPSAESAGGTTPRRPSPRGPPAFNFYAANIAVLENVLEASESALDRFALESDAPQQPADADGQIVSLSRWLPLDVILPILLDLVLYDCPSLVCQALKLVFRLCAVRREVWAQVDDMQLLFDRTSENYFETTCQQAIKLQALIAPKMSNEHEKQVVALLQQFQSHLVAGSDPVGGGIKNERMFCNAELRRALTCFFDSCRQQEAVKPQHNLLERQDMLRNAGVHQLALQFLALPFSNKSSEGGRRRIVVQAYALLSRFCHRHRRNQMLLARSGHLPLFVRHLQMDVGAEVLLREIHRDNYELAVAVSEEVLAAVLALVLLEAETSALATIFLKELVVPDGMPIPRNQTLVMAALIEQASGHLQVALQALDGTSELEAQLRVASLVDLAAMCCLGHNNASIELAQGFIPLGDLLRLLGGTEHPLQLDVQFSLVTFLRSVWIASETEASRQENLDWGHCPEWSALLIRFCGTLKAFNKDAWDPAMGDLACHVHFIFEGILPCVTDLLSVCWDAESYQAGQYLPMMVSLLEEAVLLLDTQHGDVSTLVTLEQVEHFTCFIQAAQLYIQRGGYVLGASLPLGDVLGCCAALVTERQRDADAATVQPSARRVSSPRRQPGDKGVILKAFEALQRMAQNRNVPGRYEDQHVDNIELFTERLGSVLDRSDRRSRILRALISYLQDGARGARLDDCVKASILEYLTCFGGLSLGNEERLIAVQNELDDLGASTRMIDLVAGDGILSVKAVEFGIVLLEGGNAAVQETVLRHFQAGPEHFFASVHNKLTRARTAIRHRQRELLFLKRAAMGDAQVCRKMERAWRGPLDHCHRLLRLLQLFCEGHHLNLQNYVRCQGGRVHAFNLVAEVVTFLKEVVADEGMDDVLCQLAIQGFRSVTEFCQGPCPENQRTVVEGGLCAAVHAILTQESPSCRMEAIFNLRCDAVLTVLSLLEGCDRRGRVERIAADLPVASLVAVLDKMWEALQPSIEDGSGTLYESDQALDTAFHVFILVYTLRSWLGNDPHVAQTLSGCKGSAFFTSILGTIEIARDGGLEKVYFRKPSSSLTLNKEIRHRLLADVDRSSQTNKLADFFERSQQIISSMEHRKSLTQWLNTHLPPVPLTGPPWYVAYGAPALQSARKWFVQTAPQGLRLWDDAILSTACALNLVILVSSPSPGRPLPWAEALILTLLGLDLVGLCLLALVWLWLLHQPLGSASLGDKPLSSGLTIPWRALPPHHAQYLFLAFLSLLGLLWSPVCYSFHLLLVINKSEILRSVSRSVTQNGRALLLTALLGVIIIYIFSLTGHLLFSDDFVSEDGQPQCDDVFQCFLFVMTAGIRAGGGLGDLLARKEWGEAWHTRRMVYDTLFHIVVIVIFLNIIFGIIIDTFAELRDARHRVDEDTASRCFICGVDAYTFDRCVEGGFVHHTKETHNMWQYLYFMYHLRQKPKDEFTGQESYVWDKVRVRDISFFPLHKSMDLQQAGAAAGYWGPPRKAFTTDVLGSGQSFRGFAED
eukprot:EG_transcript_44